MSTHNIRFNGELTKIILQLSPNTHLICSTDSAEAQQNLVMMCTQLKTRPHGLIRVFIECSINSQGHYPSACRQ